MKNSGKSPSAWKSLLCLCLLVCMAAGICAPAYAAAVGFIAPLLRSVTLSMPPLFPTATAMAFELAAYGALSGLLYAKLPKKPLYTYVALLLAMLGGRVVWGLVMFALTGISDTTFSLSAFVMGAFANAIPGIVLHIVLIPVIVLALRKARLTLNGR